MKASELTAEKMNELGERKRVKGCKKCFGRGFTGWVEYGEQNGWTHNGPNFKKRAVLCGCIKREMANVSSDK